MDAEATRIAERLERVFAAIGRDHMAEVPILNPRLAVAAIGTQRCGADWLALLVTPWCMNIMLLPAEEAGAGWTDWRLGDTVKRSLPAGIFGFICGEEPSLGRYLMCSLFSPMEEFVDQPAAVATAEAAARELMTAPETEAAPREARSRRILFGLGTRPEEAAS